MGIVAIPVLKASEFDRVPVDTETLQHCICTGTTGTVTEITGDALPFKGVRAADRTRGGPAPTAHCVPWAGRARGTSLRKKVSLL